jgi:hypothetical protein
VKNRILSNLALKASTGELINPSLINALGDKSKMILNLDFADKK